MGSNPTSIIAHERIAEWTGRLRPLFAADRRCRWVESRSSADLVAASQTQAEGAGGTDPVILIDLAGRPYWGLEGLLALHERHVRALVLVLDPSRTPEVPVLARELGADLVWSGVVVPPRVADLLRRWVGVQQAPRPPRHPRLSPAHPQPQSP